MVQKPFFILFVMAVLCGSCKIDRNKRVDRDKFTFRVTDDSFLFFKNVRQIYYDFQDLPQAHWYAFRFGNRPTDTDLPVLNPVIVIDWMRDESYVLVEPNEILQEEQSLLIREKNSAGRFFEYSLAERGRDNMLEFATKIYEGIVDENEIMIRSRGEYLPLFRNEEERESFRITMSDYYRLTRVF
jgi:hypothetical protein